MVRGFLVLYDRDDNPIPDTRISTAPSPPLDQYYGTFRYPFYTKASLWLPPEDMPAPPATHHISYRSRARQVAKHNKMELYFLGPSSTEASTDSSRPLDAYTPSRSHPDYESCQSCQSCQYCQSIRIPVMVWFVGCRWGRASEIDTAM